MSIVGDADRRQPAYMGSWSVRDRDVRPELVPPDIAPERVVRVLAAGRRGPGGLQLRAERDQLEGAGQISAAERKRGMAVELLAGPAILNLRTRQPRV